ncbi:MAG: diguanylate cyclase [Lachnospiraceae bacterium]|nr:diguanylate cyclase [Lachnospiraceae bacterium]
MIRFFLSSVYPPDLDMVRAALSKQNVLKTLCAEDSFSLNYRIVADEKPSYVRLKAARLRKDDPSLILFALSSSDAHMQQKARYESMAHKQLTFSAISEALASDYVCIFYVNTETNEFIEYSSNEQFKSLNLSPSGKDFFEKCRHDFSRIVLEEDRDVFLRAFEKTNLLKVLSSDCLFLLTFRVVLNETPIYVRVKITKINQLDDHHIVVGVSNIEASMQRIQKYEQMKEIANRDSLTGVGSKHAFMENEERINREIGLREASSFAVVLCDVNGLKNINDTFGHQAGDDYLRKSSQMICSVFSHSPVFRIGGDEFTVLLTEEDYKKRFELLQELHDLSASHIGTTEAVVAGGLAEYKPDRDHYLRDILDRADSTMYKEKMLLKNLGAATRESGMNKNFPDTEYIPIINIRRHILIADDQETNREILGMLLEDDYDILYAADGIETMNMLRKHKDEIALVLLDLYMPNMTGREVIRQMQVDDELMSIPVIMLTVDQDAELDSLRIGAIDFISKPYPDMEIVKARIAKCIELSENRYLIRHTQRDKLTGLLNFDYFIQYLERFDHLYKEKAFDAFVCDIQHFHAINEQFGRQFGDLVLRDIGSKIRKLARKTGGIGSRQGGDTFLLYCPHRNDYGQLISKFTADLFVDKENKDRIILRFGVFENADREQNIEKRFFCAKYAADQAANIPGAICGYY